MDAPALELNAELGDLRRLTFSPDEKSVASVGHAGHVYLWSLSSASELRRFRPGPGEEFGPMHGVAIAPDGSKIAAATWAGPIVVWDIMAEGKQDTLPGHRYSSNCVIYSACGQTLFSSGNDGRIKAWDTSAPRKRPKLSISAHSGVVETIAASPDGRYVAWGGGMDGKSLGVWCMDLESKAETPIASRHQDDVVAVAFSPCSKLVASGSWDNTVKVFDLSSQKETATFSTDKNSTVNSVCFSPDGRLLAAGGHGGNLYLWRIQDGNLLSHWPAHSEILWNVQFSPSGNHIASCGYDGKVRLWLVNN